MDLSPFIDRPSDAAVMTDFDGTLAAIVDDPARATPVDGAVAVVHALCSRYRRMAVISGRPVEFLARFLGDGPLLVGLYGLERMERGHRTIHPSAAKWIDVVAAMVERAHAEAPDGVRIEHKGLTFTLHVREAPQHEQWMASFSESVSSATGLTRHAGRKSIELKPPVAVDKGSVVAEIAEGLSAACFVGDDHGDLAAFDALDRLHADCGAAVLRVAVKSSEAPPELVERADVLVDGPEGSVDFLKSLCPTD